MLPDIPVVVISHRIDGNATSATEAKRARIWMDMQSDLARRASQGIHVISATDDHYIQLSQPQLIIDAIRDVVERSHRSSSPRHNDETVAKTDEGEGGRDPAHIG